MRVPLPADLPIVITGNPIDGFAHFGPFPGFVEAREWAEAAKLADPWWAAGLTPAGPGGETQ
jgi:hypothetical protein